MNYGERLRKARKAKKLTQNELAERSGVPQGTISKIERGDQESSTYDTVLAHTLGISAIWLTKEKGKMFSKKPPQGVNEERATYSKDDDELMEKIHQLSDADRARLSAILDALNTKLDKKTG